MSAEYVKKWRAARRQKGLCRSCGKQAIVKDGRVLSYCETHKAKTVGRIREIRDARLAAGLCLNCDQPASEGDTLCLMHIDLKKHTAKRSYWKNKDEIQKKRNGMLSEYDVGSVDAAILLWVNNRQDPYKVRINSDLVPFWVVERRLQSLRKRGLIKYNRYLRQWELTP